MMSRPASPLSAVAADRLCAAAAEAFAADNLEGASLNGILRRAGMGKGSFYHRFADKAALHDWVTDRLAAALLEEIRPPQPDALTSQSFRDELSALLARLGHVALARPELMNLGRMVHNSANASPECAIASVRRAVNTWIAQVLKVGRGLGAVRTDLPLDLLTAWSIATLTTIDQWVLTSGNGGQPRNAAPALEIFWDLITGRDAPSDHARCRCRT